MASLFPTTRWTIVRSLSESSEERVAAALESLCQQYRQPLVQYLLAAGTSPNDVDDVIQDFLSYFITKRNFEKADPERGKLRTFLMASVRNFAANVLAQQSAIKRGGGVVPVPFEEEMAAKTEEQMAPEAVFDEQWAANIMDNALKNLEGEYERRGKQEWFAQISGFLDWQPKATDYKKAAMQMKVRSNRVAVEVFRLRHRFREVVREEIGHTVSSQQEIEEELRYLATVLGRKER